VTIWKRLRDLADTLTGDDPTDAYVAAELRAIADRGEHDAAAWLAEWLR
jgi:hypothetical protein